MKMEPHIWYRPADTYEALFHFYAVVQSKISNGRAATVMKTRVQGQWGPYTSHQDQD